MYVYNDVLSKKEGKKFLNIIQEENTLYKISNSEGVKRINWIKDSEILEKKVRKYLSSAFKYKIYIFNYNVISF